MIPDHWSQITFLGNTQAQWAYAAMVLLGSLVVLWIFRVYILLFLRRLAKKTVTDIDDMLIDAVKAVHWPMYVLLAVYMSFQFVVLPAILERIFGFLVIASAVYYAVQAIGRLIDFGLNSYVKRHLEAQDSSLPKLMARIAKMVIWVFAFLFLLNNLGVAITPLIAGVGVGGIAIAFALQNILEDLFSSFTIYFDKPFQTGDFIVVGSDSGTVRYIGLKSTRVQTLQGQELVISNKELTNTRINNYKKMEERRVVFSLGVEYDTSVSKLKAIPDMITNIIDSQPDAKADRVHFREFGDSALLYEIVYYVSKRDYAIFMDLQQSINLEIVKAFQKRKIHMAFPTQTIHVVK